MLVSEWIKQVSDEMASRSVHESEYHPIDWNFVKPYLDEILSFNTVEFVYCNFERVNPLYTNHLFLCLPHLWEKIDVDDLIFMIKNFTNNFSYFTLLQFTYGHLRIDVIPLVFQFNSMTVADRRDFVQYLDLQWNILIEGMYDDEDLNLYGKQFLNYDPVRWSLITEKLVIDDRIKPALTDSGEFRTYINELVNSSSTLNWIKAGAQA